MRNFITERMSSIGRLRSFDIEGWIGITRDGWFYAIIGKRTNGSA